MFLPVTSLRSVSISLELSLIHLVLMKAVSRTECNLTLSVRSDSDYYT